MTHYKIKHKNNDVMTVLKEGTDSADKIFTNDWLSLHGKGNDMSLEVNETPEYNIELTLVSGGSYKFCAEQLKRLSVTGAGVTKFEAFNKEWHVQESIDHINEMVAKQEALNEILANPMGEDGEKSLAEETQQAEDDVNDTPDSKDSATPETKLNEIKCGNCQARIILPVGLVTDDNGYKELIIKELEEVRASLALEKSIRALFSNRLNKVDIEAWQGVLGEMTPDEKAYATGNEN